MYTFGEITTKVALIAQRSGDTDYLTKIKDWVNLGHQFVANSYDFWSELQAEYTFASVASTEKYYLPSDFDKPYRLFDFTNNRKLQWTTREEYVSSNISSVSSANTGSPQYAMLYGISAVASIISSSSTIKVKSSNTNDNSGIIIRVEGWLDSAKTILGYEDITISTSDPTTYTSGSVSFYGLTTVTKSADTTGFVTIANSASTVLATISPYDRQSRYPILYLGLIPVGAYTYNMLYKRKVKKLVSDYDYPFMNCSDFLILYAVAYAFQQEKESESRAQAFWTKANEQLMLLMRNEQNKMGSDFQHKFIPKTNQSHRS